MKVTVDGGLTWVECNSVQIIHSLDKDEPEYEYYVHHYEDRVVELVRNDMEVHGQTVTQIQDRVDELSS